MQNCQYFIKLVICSIFLLLTGNDPDVLKTDNENVTELEETNIYTDHASKKSRNDKQVNKFTACSLLEVYFTYFI